MLGQTSQQPLSAAESPASSTLPPARALRANRITTSDPNIRVDEVEIPVLAELMIAESTLGRRKTV